jgi:predicted TIM-barrel fold metal-dependent hydrolase
MMIIDAHAHIYEILKGYGSKGEFRPLGGGRGIWATGKIEQFFPAEYGDTGFHAETLIKLMDEGGIDRAVLLQGGNYGFHNDYMAEAVAKYPERLTAVGAIDPYSLYAKEIFDNLVENYKFKALKFEISSEWGLSGYHQNLRINDEAFAALLKKADTLGLTVTFDMGTKKMASFDFAAFKEVTETYRNVTFVMSHSFFPTNDGKNEERLDFAKQLTSDNFYFDFANVDLIGQSEYFKSLKNIISAERMLWGTDVPGVLFRTNYKQLIDRVKTSGIFTSAELPLVMGENAKRVYLK